MKIEFLQKLNLTELNVTVAAPEKDAKVDRLLNYLEKFPEDGAQTLLIKDHQKQVLVRVNEQEIRAVEVMGDFLQIYTPQKNYQERERLYKLKEQLSADFVQISKPVIINLNYLDHLDLSFTGTVMAQLKTGETFQVTRTYMKELRRVMADGE
ncbi:MAG: LytTR family transcriptional regulator [Lactobacillaceae bacterium]|jgi:DNA-binding LytR/AlgR family response regulator|nr:LytTR family transcriptional regulator [Lactobacillaceae bacterium]